MPNFFAYIRVSTAKQGEGVSLPQQRDAIVRYAEKAGLSIDRWFEERETAAKRGRPLFSEMLKLLQTGQAAGVVIHKIDRSARNLRDWSDLGELIDRGIDVRFANESLDLQTRGGRLSADIQAVVAADYIRNLREEARKGIYGRFKQGLYPMPAPPGYLDEGAGKPKTHDPTKGPLVLMGFEIYSKGRHSLLELATEMAARGLRNRFGGKITRTGWSGILNNPFYMGLISVKKTGETFVGVHTPLVSVDLFRRVQDVLHGRVNVKTRSHEFPFRGLLSCGLCGYALVGESQKGHVYYRCHTRGCRTKGIREELVDSRIESLLRPLQFTPRETRYLESCLASRRERWQDAARQQRDGLTLRLRQITERLARLADAFIDGNLEKAAFQERNAQLFQERRELEEALAGWDTQNSQASDRLAIFLELAKSTYSHYRMAVPSEKRKFLEIITSNRVLSAERLDIALVSALQVVADRSKCIGGGPKRTVTRTFRVFLATLDKLLRRDGSAERVLKFAQEKSTRIAESRKGLRVAA